MDSKILETSKDGLPSSEISPLESPRPGMTAENSRLRSTAENNYQPMEDSLFSTNKDSEHGDSLLLNYNLKRDFAGPSR